MRENWHSGPAAAASLTAALTFTSFSAFLLPVSHLTCFNRRSCFPLFRNALLKPLTFGGHLNRDDIKMTNFTNVVLNDCVCVFELLEKLLLVSGQKLVCSSVKC